MLIHTAPCLFLLLSKTHLFRFSLHFWLSETVKLTFLPSQVCLCCLNTNLQSKHPETVVIFLGYRDNADPNALMGDGVLRPVLHTFLRKSHSRFSLFQLKAPLRPPHLCHRRHTSFFSSKLVIITMIGLLSCHTILQKSPTVFTVGPCVAM